MKIEEPTTLLGFAWIDDETGELNWALKEDMEDMKPEDRPEGCTPVVIEISPTNEWVSKKHEEHEFLGNLQDKMNRFTEELKRLEKTFKVEAEGR